MDKDVIAAEAQMQAELNELRRSSKPRPEPKPREPDPDSMTGCDCPMCQEMVRLS